MIDPTLPRWQYRSKFNYETGSDPVIVDQSGHLNFTEAGDLTFVDQKGNLILAVNGGEWVDVWRNAEDEVVVIKPSGH